MTSAPAPHAAAPIAAASTASPTHAPSAGRLPARVAVAAVAAAVAGAAWVVADPLAGIELAVRSGSTTRTVGGVAMVLTALVVGLVAGGLLTLLERATGRAGSIWTGIAALVLLVSFVGPLGAVTAAAGWALAATHLLVGGILLVGLRRTAAAPDQPADRG